MSPQSIYFFLYPNELSSVVLVLMEQKMVFPEKSPWVLSHCRKFYKSFNLVRALKILSFFGKKKKVPVERSDLTYFHKKKIPKKKRNIFKEFSEMYAFMSGAIYLFCFLFQQNI